MDGPKDYQMLYHIKHPNGIHSYAITDEQGNISPNYDQELRSDDEVPYYVNDLEVFRILQFMSSRLILPEERCFKII
jgi:hypothetical protein